MNPRLKYANDYLNKGGSLIFNGTRGVPYKPVVTDRNYQLIYPKGEIEMKEPSIDLTIGTRAKVSQFFSVYREGYLKKYNVRAWDRYIITDRPKHATFRTKYGDLMVSVDDTTFATYVGDGKWKITNG